MRGGIGGSGGLVQHRVREDTEGEWRGFVCWVRRGEERRSEEKSGEVRRGGDF